MLENWLSPIEPSEWMAFNELQTYQIGKNIQIYNNNLPNVKDTHIVIIGVEKEAANAVRQQLYPLSYAFNGLTITDLGNLRKSHPEFLVPLLRDILQSGIFPILIGDHIKLSSSVYQAFVEEDIRVSAIAVDRTLNHVNRSNGYGYMLEKHRQRLFNMSVLGMQNAYSNPKSVSYFENQHFDYFRLGYMRDELEEVEPIVRDADLISFNLNAVACHVAPAQAAPSPSGLTLEESCQIMRYAGMSDKLRVAGIFGFEPILDGPTTSAQLIAQMIWYLLDGFNWRKKDYPYAQNALTEYLVDATFGDKALRFWKSEISGRWWLEFPNVKDKRLLRHRLIPCSYKDYIRASEQEFSERLINAINRFEIQHSDQMLH